MIFNLLKSDLYRMVRMPLFWGYVVIAFTMCLVSAGVVSYLASPEFAQVVNDQIEANQTSDMSETETASEVSERQEDQAEVKALNKKELPSLSYAWASFFMDTGFLGILGSCFIGFHLVRDIQSGFIKNLSLDKRSRRTYFAEKLIFTAFMQAFFQTFCFVVGTILFSLFGITFEVEESIGFLAMWGALAWLILTAYAFLVACMSWIVKSEWIPAFGSVFISSGIIGTVLIQLSELLVPTFPALKMLPYWTLAGTSTALDVGESEFFAQASAYPIPAIGPEGQIVLVAGVVIMAAAVFVMAVCRKQNIK